MASLLAKFRIDYSDVNVIPDVTKKASPETRQEYQVCSTNLESLSWCAIKSVLINWL